MFTWDNFQKLFLEWIKTFSQRASFLSSKKIEKFVFSGVSVIVILGTFVYLWINKTLTATEAVILVTPLLLAAGYNLKKSEEEKTSNKLPD